MSVRESVAEAQPALPAMDEILGRRYTPDILMWAALPLRVERIFDETGAERFEASWPDVTLSQRGLVTFLNVAAPVADGEAGIRNDLILQLEEFDRFPDWLREKHAASFPRLWGKHEAYARRAYTALGYEPRVYDFIAEVEGETYCIGDSEIITLEDKLASITTGSSIVPSTNLQALLEKYDMAHIYDILPDTKELGTDKASKLVPGQVMRQLLDMHPEASAETAEVFEGMVFDGGVYGEKLVAHEAEQSKEVLEAMFLSGEGIFTAETDYYTFDYFISGCEITPIMSTVKIYDPRPHLSPVLVWQKRQNGQREIMYDAPTRDYEVTDGHATFTVIEDPMLGVLIPFIFCPEFRDNEDLWPRRDSLPADKIAARNGDLDQVSTNIINPANVVLQAARKRHEIVNHFPFDALERVAQ